MASRWKYEEYENIHNKIIIILIKLSIIVNFWEWPSIFLRKLSYDWNTLIFISKQTHMKPWYPGDPNHAFIRFFVFQAWNLSWFFRSIFHILDRFIMVWREPLWRLFTVRIENFRGVRSFFVTCWACLKEYYCERHIVELFMIVLFFLELNPQLLTLRLWYYLDI